MFMFEKYGNSRAYTRFGGGGAFLFIFGNLLEAMHFARGVLGHGVYLDQILS